MYTITAQGKFLFKLVPLKLSRVNHTFSLIIIIDILQRYVETPLNFFPEKTFFFFNYYITTVVDKQRFCWVTKRTWAQSKHAGNK